MSFSDFILAILVLAGIACVLWVYDINPYTNKFQIYTQKCDNMILDNTYCKGSWQNQPVKTFIVDQQTNQVTLDLGNQTEKISYDECSIEDRKNWVCTQTTTDEEIIFHDGILKINKRSDVRQLSRLEWLQNKILELVN